MDLCPDSTCPKCCREKGDLIYLLWRCPKLHRYWDSIVRTINNIFHADVSLDPKPCLLGVLEEVIQDAYVREAVGRALSDPQTGVDALDCANDTLNADVDRSNGHYP